ncbi:hypothetical protein BCV70DRAFT_121922 [Testicularia cyperi]|uniref:Uncharacterized protein n=1 Tax=Testicularia cyperi TaxID=1882483 RepID=A0A317XL03_9BASI|nr:hypothetical protein BCV70DRAFT_121922 [Testicularia cyperi]
MLPLVLSRFPLFRRNPVLCLQVCCFPLSLALFCILVIPILSSREQSLASSRCCQSSPVGPRTALEMKYIYSNYVRLTCVTAPPQGCARLVWEIALRWAAATTPTSTSAHRVPSACTHIRLSSIRCNERMGPNACAHRPSISV